MKNGKAVVLLSFAIFVAVALAGTRLSFQSTAAKVALNSTPSISAAPEKTLAQSQKGVPNRSMTEVIQQRYLEHGSDGNGTELNRNFTAFGRRFRVSVRSHASSYNLAH